MAGHLFQRQNSYLQFPLTSLAIAFTGTECSGLLHLQNSAEKYLSPWIFRRRPTQTIFSAGLMARQKVCIAAILSNQTGSRESFRRVSWHAESGH